MKTIHVLYWLSTGLLGLSMAFSGVQNAMVTQESIAIIGSHLGYPEYIIPFLGLAKVLGAIAILIPGFPRLKEWAYAGLFFDLLGAAYSTLVVDGLQPGTMFMVVFFLFLGLSYGLHHKRLKIKSASEQNAPVAV